MTAQMPFRRAPRLVGPKKLYRQVPHLVLEEASAGWSNRDLPTGRFYTDGQEAFPSVTTVLGSIGDKTWLEEWRKKIGEEKADKITQDALRRGTALHDFLEKWFSNRVQEGHTFPTPHIQDQIRRNPGVLAAIDDVIAQEKALYSRKLRIAGRMDMAASWHGVPSVIDFKTARNLKTVADINGYFLQATLYGWMLFEMSGLKLPQIVILVFNDGAPASVFVEDMRIWLPRAELAVDEYYRYSSTEMPCLSD